MNSFYNLLDIVKSETEKTPHVSLLNELLADKSQEFNDFLGLEIIRQQTQSILKLEQLGANVIVSPNVFEALKSKLCYFVEKLNYSNKYSFDDFSIEALREDSLYIILKGKQELSINLFVDEEDIYSDQETNEEEVFLTYRIKGKECVTCDSISNIFSVIEQL